MRKWGDRITSGSRLFSARFLVLQLTSRDGTPYPGEQREDVARRRKRPGERDRERRRHQDLRGRRPLAHGVREAEEDDRGAHTRRRRRRGRTRHRVAADRRARRPRTARASVRGPLARPKSGRVPKCNVRVSGSRGRTRRSPEPPAGAPGAPWYGPAMTRRVRSTAPARPQACDFPRRGARLGARTYS